MTDRPSGPRIAALSLVLSLSSALAGPARAGCDAKSGAKTAALVELYTSEGCSSCPPADRQLSRLSEALEAGALAVPLSLHVSYWDAIGWKDPFAQTAFVERQRALVKARGGSSVYTPQFFVGGEEARSWPETFAASVRRINAAPAAADIRIQAAPAANGMLALTAQASARDTSTPAALYVAVTEDGLVSRVLRGENGGSTLGHDGVARAWIGPIAFERGAAAVQREVALPAGWNRDRLSVVAFVQDARSGAVLQALKASQCARS